MGRLVEHMRRDFHGRVSTPRALGAVAVGWPRLALASLLAVVPALALLLAAWLGPADLARAVTDAQNAHDLFTRYITAVATASSIAVSIAALSMRRDLKGIRSHEERRDANADYRERVRERAGRDELPLDLAGFLAETLASVAREARAAREGASREELALESEGVRLGELLEVLEARAAEVGRALAATGPRPDRQLLAALDFEHEASHRLSRRFARDGRLGGATRARVATLRDQLGDFVLGQKYLKTLDTQWGLGRMSMAILLSTLPSIAVASFMVLAYGEGAVDALGLAGASALVAAALAVCLFPIGCFVSYVLRFLFVNEHTLPTDGFLLGPEAKALRRDE